MACTYRRAAGEPDRLGRGGCQLDVVGVISSFIFLRPPAGSCLETSISSRRGLHPGASRRKLPAPQIHFDREAGIPSCRSHSSRCGRSKALAHQKRIGRRAPVGRGRLRLGDQVIVAVGW